MQIELTPTLRSLQLQSQTVSIESLSRYLPNKGLLIQLSSLASSASAFISDKTAALLQRNNEMKFMLSGSPSSSLSKINYTDLKDVALPCPEGLRISFMEYALLLQESQKVTSYIFENCLYPFANFIGESLNYPEKMASSIRTSGVKLQNLDQLRKKLNAAFDGVNGTIPYMKAIRRNVEWDDLEKTVAKVVATQKQTNDKLIGEKINEVQANLNTLINNMQNTNDRYRPSTELINELSKLTYGLAEQVTFYSIIATSVEAFVVAYEESKQVVKSFAKK